MYPSERDIPKVHTSYQPTNNCASLIIRGHILVPFILFLVHKEEEKN
jgi:hypothetical protein